MTDCISLPGLPEYCSSRYLARQKGKDGVLVPVRPEAHTYPANIGLLEPITPMLAAHSALMRLQNGLSPISSPIHLPGRSVTHAFLVRQHVSVPQEGRHGSMWLNPAQPHSQARVELSHPLTELGLLTSPPSLHTVTGVIT